MKTLTRDAVGLVTRALITLNGKTTTLEVKTALRKKGFWATQADVRELMLDILSQDGDIDYTDNGTHRIYSFRQPPFGPDDPSAAHDLDHRNICKKCGCSQGAIVAFGWGCKPSGSVVTPWFDGTRQVSLPPLAQAVTAATRIGVLVTPLLDHRDYRPANYLVTGEDGLDSRWYDGVTRSQAKAHWTNDTGRDYSEARTRKV